MLYNFKYIEQLFYQVANTSFVYIRIAPGSFLLVDLSLVPIPSTLPNPPQHWMV